MYDVFIPNIENLLFHYTPSKIAEEHFEIDIDLSKDIAISNPWNRERFVDILFKLANEEWKYDKFNHQADYYEPLKITIIRNGMHFSAAGILKRQGILPANKLSIEYLYEYIKTDGVNFYR